MGGFLEGLTSLLGGFAAKDQIDKDGFDYQQIRDQKRLEREQEAQKFQQANEDWATKAATDIALGAEPGQDMSSLLGDKVNKARIMARSAGGVAQSKPALKSQDSFNRMNERTLANQGALDVANARGEQAQALARVKASLDANEEPSPRDIALITKRGEIQKDVANTIAGRRGEKLYPITTTDAKGNTIQTFITEAQARSMAGGNAAATGAGQAMTGIAKPEGQTVQARVRGAAASLQVGNKILESLSDPAVQAELGPIIGRYNSLEAAAGAGEPIAMKIYGEIKGYSALQPGIHGMRSVQMMKDIEDSLKIGQTPEALAAKIRGINSAAEALINPSSALPGERVFEVNGKKYHLRPGADPKLKSSYEEIP